MSKLTSAQLEEFRTSCARMRNVPEFKVILAFIQNREAHYKSVLVGANATDVPHLQGRARECAELLQEFHKTKD